MLTRSYSLCSRRFIDIRSAHQRVGPCVSFRAVVGWGTPLGERAECLDCWCNGRFPLPLSRAGLGFQQTWNGVSSTVEHERTANALLLFYEKVRPREFPEDEKARGAARNGRDNASASETPHEAQGGVGGEPTGAAAGSKGEAVAEDSHSSVGTARVTSSSSSMSTSSSTPTVGKPVSDNGNSTSSCGSSSSGRGAPAAESKGDHPDNMSTSTESDLEGGGDDKSSAPGVGGSRRAMVKAGRHAAGSKGGGNGKRALKVSLLDGIEAYSEEVWQANVQFMLNSYVFDTEFHHFLRRVVAYAVCLTMSSRICRVSWQC